MDPSPGSSDTTCDWLPERLAVFHHMDDALECRFGLDQLHERGALELEQLLLAQRGVRLVFPPQSTVDNALETTASCPVILPCALKHRPCRR